MGTLIYIFKNRDPSLEAWSSQHIYEFGKRTPEKDFWLLIWVEGQQGFKVIRANFYAIKGLSYIG